jgi:hypothetical protein
MVRELLDYHDEASAAKRVERARRAFERGFSSHIGCCLTVIASSLFPRIPLGLSSGLGAFRATPGAPHLECSVMYILYVLIAVTTYKPI